jgi:hypothetical protein
MQTVLSRLVLGCVFLSVGIRATAQNPKALKYDVRTLTGASFSGRGYVDKGCEKAAR